MEKSEKFDQYYTKYSVAEHCCRVLKELFPECSDKTFMEPSAGTGVFVDAIHKIFGEVKVKAYDIDPKRKDIVKADFTIYNFKGNNLITVGNPPFGKRSSLAISFFNISAKKSDIIAFIVPVQFEKYSVQKCLNIEFKLAHSERLPKNSFIYDGKDCDIRCVFQIWSRLDKEYKNLRITQPPVISHPDFEMFLYNNTEQARKFFDKEKYKWAFAVPRQGYYDYSLRIENQQDLNPKIQYMFFKSEKQTVLEKIKKIDFEKLSKNNTTIPGFGKADVVKAYNEMEEDKNG